MKSLEFREKRGRPDIIHQCLLLLLDSPFRDFEVYVHTINGQLIWVNRETRLPRNYNRFVGLMEKLFLEKRIVAGEKTLMEIVEGSLREAVQGREVLLFREKGECVDFRGLFREMLQSALVHFRTVIFLRKPSESWETFERLVLVRKATQAFM